MPRIDFGSSPVRLAELVASLSLASDLGMGQPLEHALQTCLLSVRTGRALGLGEEELREVYYVALLRSAGCTADSHAAAERFGDEIAVRAKLATVDSGDMSAMAKFMLLHVGEGNPPVRRARMVAAAFKAGPEDGRRSIAAHCEVAQMLAARLGLGDDVQEGLAQVFERWDGRGLPAGRKGEQTRVSARLVQVTRDAVVFHQLGGVSAALAIVRQRSGKAYDPEVAARFCQEAPGLLGELESISVWDAVMAAEPGKKRIITGGKLDDAAEVIGDFVGLLSPCFVGHSRGVAELAEVAARRMGLPEQDIHALKLAGLMHDLGRVSVSTSIWDKPGRLAGGEWERVRLHSYYTERLLARSPALAPLGALAGLHHERMDGSGYHHGDSAPQLSLAARLLAAADVYHALIEPRAYRDLHSPEEAAKLLLQEARAGRLDGKAVDAILIAAGHRVPKTYPRWPAGLSDREVEVLRLISQGLSNHAMSARLHIADKTVGHHIQHIYNKIGVSTRAGATLFAMQHGLLSDR